MSSPQRHRVTEDEAGTRLDLVLAHRSEAPRNQVQRWIKEGRVRVGTTVRRRPSHAVNGGDEVIWEVPPPPTDSRVQPEEGPLKVLWDDEHLIFVYKPPNLVVHPGAGHATGTLVHRLLARYPEVEGVGGPGRPGIVHRLDRDTSGVMVLARTDTAYRSLSAAFTHRRVAKTYCAVVYDRARGAHQGTIDAAIGRHPHRRHEMTVLHRGRRSVTHWLRAGATGPLGLWVLDLETGRTHQIRVHCRHVGHPLVGDPVYGERRWKAWNGPGRRSLETFPRPALHAWRLQVPHPLPERPAVTVTAPVPTDLRDLWHATATAPWPDEALRAAAATLATGREATRATPPAE